MGKPRKKKLPDLDLSPQELALLLVGKNRGSKWAPGSAHKDAASAWEAHGADLVRLWADPKRAGTEVMVQMRGGPVLRFPGASHRPWWWWHRIAGEPRRLVLDDGTTAEFWTKNWAKGLRVDWCERGRGRFSFGCPTSCPRGLEFETEGAYLERLDLLLEEER